MELVQVLQSLHSSNKYAYISWILATCQNKCKKGNDKEYLIWYYFETCIIFLMLIISYGTTRNSVICNHPICNWDATACRMQLCRVFYATTMDFCPLFGCVCNYGATMIAFIPTFGWFVWIYTIVYIPLDVFYRIYLICIYS
jgi:hypothetical protein